MELDILEVKQEVQAIDTEELLTITEDAAELEQDLESTLNTVTDLLAMSYEYETILDKADRESITESQVIALRTGVVAGMQASNADAESMLGIDIESTILVPASSLSYDLEGVKDFVKKVWEKFKKGLIKANTTFKKLFLKFLNFVSFRKGTLETLLEDMESASTINTDIKDSKLASGLFFVKPGGAELDLSKYDKVWCAKKGNIVSFDAVSEAVKLIGERAKELDESLKTKTPNPFSDRIAKLYFENLRISIVDSSPLNAILLADEKLAENGALTVGAYSGKLFGLMFTKDNHVKKLAVKVKGASKLKSIKGIKQSNMISLLKDAETVNGDFKSTVNEVFGIVDDVMDIVDDMDSTLSGLDTGFTTKDNLKEFNKSKKQLQSVISLTPWMAFKSLMSIYKEVGGVIRLSKKVLDDKKDK